MDTPLIAAALARLPERQAHYEACCQTLRARLAAGQVRHIDSAQEVVGFALASLNATRAAAGLAPLAGPPLLSARELLTRLLTPAA